MSVERRHRKRIEHLLDINITYRRRSFHGTISNLSRDGAFIKPRMLTIPTGNMIDLTFSLNGSEWQIPALIIHTTLHGMGVLFRTPQPELESMIKQQLNEPVPTFASLPLADVSTLPR